MTALPPHIEAALREIGTGLSRPAPAPVDRRPVRVALDAKGEPEF